MQTLINNFYFAVQRLIHREEGQDLAEYALVFALVAFGATSGMNFFAAAVLDAFVQVAQMVTTNIT